MNLNIALGLSNIGAAVLFAVMALPLIQGKVKMNRVYGVRIKKAFVSNELWYKINSYGGRCLLAWSAVLAILGLVVFFLPLGTREQPNEAMTLVVALAPLMVLVPCIAQILAYARKL